MEKYIKKIIFGIIAIITLVVFIFYFVLWYIKITFPVLDHWKAKYGYFVLSSSPAPRGSTILEFLVTVHLKPSSTFRGVISSFKFWP